MRCPGCKHEGLTQKHLSNHLKIYSCQSCGGAWISGVDYGNWLNLRPGQFPPSTESVNSAPIGKVQDSKKAKICAGCHHIMSRYSIQGDINFQLNQCGHCGSFWLDAGQWEILEYQGLHRNLCTIASSSWQRNIRQTQRKLFIENVYVDRLSLDYDNVQKIQHWLANHPERRTILAYLNHPDWSHLTYVADSNRQQTQINKQQ